MSPHVLRTGGRGSDQENRDANVLEQISINSVLEGQGYTPEVLSPDETVAILMGLIQGQGTHAKNQRLMALILRNPQLRIALRAFQHKQSRF